MKPDRDHNLAPRHMPQWKLILLMGLTVALFILLATRQETVSALLSTLPIA